MLPELPDEILLGIFRHFAISDEVDVDLNHYTHKSTTWRKIKTLAKLCLVCKTFQVLATPLLYQTFPKPNTIYQRYRHFPPEPRPCPHLRLFLRTVMERPSLGLLVKNLFIGPFEMKTDARAQNHNHPYPCTEELRQQSRQTASRFLMPNHSNWTKDLCDEVSLEDAEIALLLCLVDNISELSLTFAMSYHDLVDSSYSLGFLEAFNPSVTARLPSYGHLRTLSLTLPRLSEAKTTAAFNFPRISDVCRISTLESLYLSGFFDYWSQRSGGNKLVKLRHLELSACSLPTTEISKLLNLCPNLTSLDLEYGHMQPAYDGLEFYFPGQPRIYSNPTWKSITDSLRSASRSLECLKLSAYVTGSRWSLGSTVLSNEDPNENSVVGSFEEFTALRHLSVPADEFIGSYEWHDACLNLQYMGYGRPDGSPTDRLGLLPPNIEHLEITDIHSDMTLNHLEQAASVLRERFPHLRHIDVGGVENLVKVLDDLSEQVIRARLLDSKLKADGITGLELPDHWVALGNYDDSSEDESEEDDPTLQDPATQVDVQLTLARLQEQKGYIDRCLPDHLASLLKSSLRSSKALLKKQQVTKRDVKRVDDIYNAVEEAIILAHGYRMARD